MKVEALQEQLALARDRLSILQDRVADAAPAPSPAHEAVDELANALEELHASEEELRATNEQLVATRGDLEAERQWYKDLFDAAPEGYIVTTREGIIQDANRAAAGLLGVPHDRLVGKPLSVYIAEAERRDFRTTLWQLPALGRREGWEMHLTPRGAGPKAITATVASRHDGHGLTVGLGWLLRDDTIRDQQAAEALEREHLTMLVAEVGTALSEETPLPEMLHACSESIARHLGAAVARIWTFNEPEQVLELVASAGPAAQSERVLNRVAVGRFKIGRIARDRQPDLTNAVIGDPEIFDPAWAEREKMIAFAGYPLLLRDRLLGVVAVFARQPLTNAAIDGLGAVAREMALGIERRFTEDRMRALVEAAPDALVICDSEGQIMLVNSQTERLFGYQRTELVGQPVEQLMPERFRLRHLTHRAHYSATPTARAMGGGLALYARHKDGREFPIEVSLSPIETGTTRFIASSIRDISDRKAVERRLADLSSELLRTQDEAQRRIARELHDGTAQHLAALSMNLAVLDGQISRSNHEGRHVLADTMALAGRCTREIRTLSYLLHPPGLDETGLASAVRWYAEGFGQRSGIRVDLHVPRDFGRLPQPIELALFRVLQESLTNVHRHAESPMVHIALARTATHVTLDVRDQGKGLPAEFAQSSLSENLSCLGIGIMGMRERVRLLGGELAITSPRGSGGTSVKVIIPLSGVAP